MNGPSQTPDPPFDTFWLPSQSRLQSGISADATGSPAKTKGPHSAANRVRQSQLFKRHGEIKAFYFSMTALLKDILLWICQVVKLFSVKVWENCCAAKSFPLIPLTPFTFLQFFSCSPLLLPLSRSTEGLPARAAIPSDHQAPV